jgi:hypothetical protein
MKTLFKRLVRRFASWALREELNEAWKYADSEIDGYQKAAHAAIKEAEAYRALLCQLRVRQTKEDGRLGWAVQAFIPDEVLERLRRKPELINRFIGQVSDKLVIQALKGIEKVTQPGDRVCAILFEKLGNGPAVISAMQENCKRPTIFKLKSNGDREEMLYLPGQMTRNVFVAIENAITQNKPLNIGTIKRKLLNENVPSDRETNLDK